MSKAVGVNMAGPMKNASAVNPDIMEELLSKNSTKL